MVTLLLGVAYMKVYLCNNNYIMYESCMPVLYYCMYESMPVLSCMCVQMRMYNYMLYVYMQTCCWLQEVQVGVIHYIIHFVICLHCS